MITQNKCCIQRINFGAYEHIPDPINIDEKASSKLKLQGNSTCAIILREVALFNKLVCHLEQQTREIKLLFEGKSSSSPRLLSDIKNVVDGIVPHSWYGPFAHRYTQGARRKIPLAFWCKQISYRREYLDSICKGSIIFKTDVRLGFLLLPLLAVNDLVSQRHKYWDVCPSASDVEMEDSAAIAKDVEAESKIQMPEDAIIFTHNYIDGARWDFKSAQLIEVDSSKLYTRMPNIYCSEKCPEKLKATKNNSYDCPFF